MSPLDLEDAINRLNRIRAEIDGLIAELKSNRAEGVWRHKPIEEAELSKRAWDCLQRLGVKTMGGIYDLTDWQIRRLPNVGPTTLRELREAVEQCQKDFP